MKEIKVKEWEEIPENFTGVVKYLNGDKEWWVEGNLHREDGPARITSHEDFYLNGNKIFVVLNLFKILLFYQKPNTHIILL